MDQIHNHTGAGIKWLRPRRSTLDQFMKQTFKVHGLGDVVVACGCFEIMKGSVEIRVRILRWNVRIVPVN